MRIIVAIAVVILAAGGAGIWFLTSGGEVPPRANLAQSDSSPQADADTPADAGTDGDDNGNGGRGAGPDGAEDAEDVPEAGPEADGASAVGLRVCNQTQNPVSVALGYRAERGWQSEGWWIAAPEDCTTVYRGGLTSRYYYLFVADDMSGGYWDGPVYMCTQDESFTIFGVEDCLARGYERTGFFEVDTGERQNWTLRLTENDMISQDSE